MALKKKESGSGHKTNCNIPLQTSSMSISNPQNISYLSADNVHRMINQKGL
jgi:hypothetical protein